MVEIPVQKKSSLAWLWLLLGLLIVGLLLWWVFADNDDAERAAVAPAQVAASGVDPAPVTAPGVGTQVTAGSIAAILANPAVHVGRDDFAAEVQVPEVPTDRGFWVENEGARMFALIIDVPIDAVKDINSGQRLRVTNGMLRDKSSLGEIPGRPLEPETLRILENQPIFLIVDEDDIEILSQPAT